MSVAVFLRAFSDFVRHFCLQLNAEFFGDCFFEHSAVIMMKHFVLFFELVLVLDSDQFFVSLHI